MKQQRLEINEIESRKTNRKKKNPVKLKFKINKTDKLSIDHDKGGGRKKKYKLPK